MPLAGPFIGKFSKFRQPQLNKQYSTVCKLCLGNKTMTTFDECTILRNKPPPSILVNVRQRVASFSAVDVRHFVRFFSIQIFVAHSASGGGKPTDMCQLFANFFFLLYLFLSFLVSFTYPLTRVVSCACMLPQGEKGDLKNVRF